MFIALDAPHEDAEVVVRQLGAAGIVRKPTVKPGAQRGNEEPPLAPYLNPVLERLRRAPLVAATFDLKTATAYEAEIERAIQRVLVSHLMQLANGAPMAQVRAIAAMKLKGIETRMNAKVATPPGPGETAHRQMLAGDINRFFTGPGDPASRIIPVPGIPPGAPIGDSPLDYLLGLGLECMAPIIR